MTSSRTASYDSSSLVTRTSELTNKKIEELALRNKEVLSFEAYREENLLTEDAYKKEMQELFRGTLSQERLERAYSLYCHSSYNGYRQDLVQSGHYTVL